MAQPVPPTVSYEQYLEIERRSETKHEFHDGEIRAMSGGTIEHGRLASRITYSIRQALGGRPCELYSSDAKIRVEAVNRTLYPDVSVVCGGLERSEVDPEAIANPTVIVEVLSESTEGYDRGEKFRYYRRIPSLKEYVLVSQHEPLVEVWRRAGEGWVPVEHGPGETARLESLEASIDVDALYANALG